MAASARAKKLVWQRAVGSGCSSFPLAHLLSKSSQLLLSTRCSWLPLFCSLLLLPLFCSLFSTLSFRHSLSVPFPIPHSPLATLSARSPASLCCLQAARTQAQTEGRRYERLGRRVHLFARVHLRAPATLSAARARPQPQTLFGPGARQKAANANANLLPPGVGGALAALLSSYLAGSLSS